MSMKHYYDMDGKPFEDRDQYLAYLKEKGDGRGWRIVGQAVLSNGYFVSTVFLYGIDHSFGQGEGPVLYETMVFNTLRAKDKKKAYNGPGLNKYVWTGGDVYCGRYSTFEEARNGHLNVCLAWSYAKRGRRGR